MVSGRCHAVVSKYEQYGILIHRVGDQTSIAHREEMKLISISNPPFTKPNMVQLHHYLYEIARVTTLFGINSMSNAIEIAQHKA